MMLSDLRKRLVFLFAGSIMIVFFMVFVLLFFDNIRIRQKNDLDLLNHQATNLTLFLQNVSPNQVCLKDWEMEGHFIIRLSGTKQTFYESDGTHDLCCEFIKKANASLKVEDLEERFPEASQSGVLSFKLSDGYTYRGVLGKNGNGRSNVTLLMMQKEDPLKQVLPYLIHYLLILSAVLSIVAVVSRILVRLALKPAAMSMQSQKDFIAGVSHELKAPLAVILSSADCLQALPDCSPETEKQAEMIAGEVDRLTRLVNDLLLLSSMDAGNWVLHISRIDIDTFLIGLYEKYEPVCRKKKIRLDLNIDDMFTQPLQSDRNRLEQILSALLGNAVSYSPENSAIQLCASLSEDKLRISVIDHGIGIPASEKSRVFERFFRVDRSRQNRDHFGLGLSIVHELVQKLNGTISLEDTEGGGCTFTLTLPMAAAE